MFFFLYLDDTSLRLLGPPEFPAMLIVELLLGVVAPLPSKPAPRDVPCWPPREDLMLGVVRFVRPPSFSGPALREP